jgi:hypothetical protein
MQVLIDEFSKRLRKSVDDFLFKEPQAQSQERVSTGSVCLSVMSDWDSDNTAARENPWGAEMYSELEEVE